MGEGRGRGSEGEGGSRWGGFLTAGLLLSADAQWASGAGAVINVST